MAEIKTKVTDANVNDFIQDFANTEQKRADSFELIKIMREETGWEPKMCGPTMIGFGTYHYESTRSSQKGDWFQVGFSPRKAAISLYVYSGGEDQKDLLKDLGKYKMGKACIYINKLSHINEEVLRKIIRSTLEFISKEYT
ncbi:DUF1801 domain-containing protein [Antarcticibacterium sp. W02-3]|uniref:DUF1801 domain-containing protein n=1 Tax=Antarcticibacterium sp. W02-3 TaxID=2183747 RepID=UPI002043A448|nr:DUF1801 domain-containing protein [Antarcticibacterium sp. W02-3]MCM4161898.1 DUF1801 domain-containing protein [Antarcticibacterium sp. W02-3]